MYSAAKIQFSDVELRFALCKLVVLYQSEDNSAVCLLTDAVYRACCRSLLTLVIQLQTVILFAQGEFLCF